MSTDALTRPTPLLRPLPQATELPLADLGPLTDPINAITTLTQAPAALALQGVMTAMSIAAQAHANAETLFGEAPLSLFAISVAESSARKSSVDKLAMKAIRDFERPRMADYMRQLALYDELEDTPGHRRDPFAVTEDEHAVNSAIPMSCPINPKICFDDMTYEGLVRHFEFGQPSIGLSSDEGGKILGGYAFSQQNQLAFAAAFSNLWDGKDINKLRAGSGSSNFAGRRVSLHLSIQSMIAQKLFANEEIKDQGLLSRILVVMPDSLRGSRTLREDKESQRQRQAANEVLHRYGEQITRLLKKRAKCSEDNRQELTPPTLRLSSASRRHLVEFYNLVETQQADDGLYANISGFAGKAAEQAARIAGVLSLFEDAEMERIDERHMDVAITLMMFYLDEVVRIFDTGHVSQKVLDAELLRVWLSARYSEDYVDVSEISRCGPGKFRSSPYIKDLVRLLEAYGHLEKAGGQRIEIKNRVSRSSYRVVRG